jgi:hypothetical protein
VLALKFPLLHCKFPLSPSNANFKIFGQMQKFLYTILSLLLLNEAKFEIQAKSPNYSLHGMLSLLSIILPFRLLTFYLASRTTVQEE